MKNIINVIKLYKEYVILFIKKFKFALFNFLGVIFELLDAIYLLFLFWKVITPSFQYKQSIFLRIAQYFHSKVLKMMMDE